MKIYIQFGGFYSSVHSDYIDSLIESEIGYDEESTFNYEDFDYKSIYKQYCKYYLKYLFKQINEWYSIKLTVKSKDIGLFSPNFYNFETDEIIWDNVSNTNQKNLKRLFNMLFEDDVKFQEYIKINTTTRDGYIPFYTQFQITDLDYPEVSYRMLLSYLARDINKNLDCEYFENLELTLKYL